MPEPACLRCQHPIGPAVPAWEDATGGRLCIPCAMGLTLPDRLAGGAGAPSPRFALPPMVAEAISAEIDLGTGRTWPVTIAEFSVEGLRLLSPVAFSAGTPAVVVLRDHTGTVAPAVFAVEVRWARGGADGRATLGTRVIAAVDGHHAAFLACVLERVWAAAAR